MASSSVNSNALNIRSYLFLIFTLHLYPFAISSTMFYLIGADYKTSVNTIVEFYIIWLSLFTTSAILYKKVDRKIFNTILTITILFGTCWSLADVSTNLFRFYIVVAILTLAFKLKEKHRSAYRLGVFIAVVSIMVITVIHHMLFLYGGTQGISDDLKSDLQVMVSEDHKEWSIGECELKNWGYAECYRFPNEHIEDFGSWPDLDNSLESIKSQYKETNEKVVETVTYRHNVSKHWAFSFDGNVWQILIKHEFYFEKASIILLVWLWVFATTVWSFMWLFLVNWHQSNSPNNRKKNYKTVLFVVGGLFATHITHISVLLLYAQELIIHLVGSDPTYLALTEPFVTRGLKTILVMSFVGWGGITLGLYLFHQWVFRKRRLKRMARAASRKV